MSFEIGDGLEKLTEWLLAIPGSVPILLGASPQTASLVRAIATLFLIAFVVYVIAQRPLRSIFAFFKSNSSKGKKPD